MFHPAVNNRVEEVGLAYEKLAHSCIKFEKNCLQLFDKIAEHSTTSMNLNNQHLELEKQKELPKMVLDTRLDKLEQMAQLGKNLMPSLGKLVYETKPLLDRIYDFKEIFLTHLQQLADNADNEKESRQIIQSLEQKFAPLQSNYDVATERYIEANNKAEQMFNMLKEFVN